MRVKKITRAKFKKACKDSIGIISTIARRIGCSREAIYNYIAKYPEFKEMIDIERQTLVDMSEGVLVTKLKEKNLDATKFILSRLGKNRGYVERTEVVNSGDMSVSIGKLTDKEKESLLRDLKEK